MQRVSADDYRMMLDAFSAARERATLAGALGPLALADALARIDWNASEAFAQALDMLASWPLYDAAHLAPFATFVPGRYTRHCVYRDDRFELLVMGWPAGLDSPIHDHGGSRGGVRVLGGTLRVEDFAINDGGRAPGPARLQAIGTRLVEVGAVDALTPERDVHRVGAIGGDALSLHLYAGPLDRCLVFDLEAQQCGVRVSAYDTPPPSL
jgi:predicted metal-dependent enzyme (double-stranded beta helix superfamily)